MLPNYAFPRADQGWKTYDEYLDYYIAEYKPQVLCFDHYPWFEVGDTKPFTPPTWAYPLSTRDGYRQNLLTIRGKALQHGNIPFWNCKMVMFSRFVALSVSLTRNVDD